MIRTLLHQITFTKTLIILASIALISLGFYEIGKMAPETGFDRSEIPEDIYSVFGGIGLMGMILSAAGLVLMLVVGLIDAIWRRIGR